MNRLEYFYHFLQDKNIASVTPTSSFGIKRVCRRIDFSKRNIIVEYGPGTGVFTRFLLEQMNPESKLILIETNRHFVSLLKQIDDPRLYVFNDSAENIRNILKECGEEKADHVISGIPFSILDEEVKTQIMRNTRDALSEEGTFLVYQFLNHAKKYLIQYFNYVHSEFEIFNLPPLFIYEAAV